MGLTLTNYKNDSSLSSLPQWYQQAIAEAYQIAKAQAKNDIALPELRRNNRVAFESTAREVILSGPAGTGKSRAWLTKAHYAASKYPGARILLLRKTRESMTDSTLVTFERDVLGEGHPLTFGPSREGRHSYSYANGSEIVVAGMKQSGKDMTAKIMSTDYDLIIVPEAIEFQLAEWERLLTRLRSGVLPYQQLGGDCNPGPPTHWIWSRQLSGRMEFLNSEHRDNPRWHDGQDWTPEGLAYLETLDLLSGYTRARLKDGLWVRAEGVVYDTWDDSQNVTPLAEYEKDAGPVYWAIDDGYSAGSAQSTAGIDTNTGSYVADAHPRVILLCQMKPDGHLDIFHESYACLKLSDVHISEVLGICEVGGIAFPEFATHGPGSSEIRGRLRAAQISPRKALSGEQWVDASVKELRRWLAADKNGWRRVRVHPRCKHLRAEMVSCAYDTNGAIAKQFDHGPDAARGLTWVLRYDEPDKE